MATTDRRIFDPAEANNARFRSDVLVLPLNDKGEYAMIDVPRNSAPSIAAIFKVIIAQVVCDEGQID